MTSVLAMSFFGGEPLFQLLLIIAMLFTGIYNALWKEPVAVLGGKRLIFLRSLFVVLLVLPWSLYNGFSTFDIDPSLDSPSFVALIMVFFLAYPGLYFFVKATKSGPTSVVVPVSSSVAILVPMIPHLVYFHDLDFHHFSLFGFALLISGLLLLKFRLSNGKIVYTGNAGFWYAVLAALLTGTVFGISEMIFTSVGPIVTLIVQEGSILLFSFGHILISRYIGIRKKMKAGNSAFRWSPEQMRIHWKNYAWIIGLIGILSGVAIVCRMSSHAAPLPMSTFILSFSGLISVITAQLYYSEKLRPQQQLAVFLLIAGIFIISWIGDGQLRGWEVFPKD